MYHRSFLLFNGLKKNQSQTTHIQHRNIIASPPTHNPTCITYTHKQTPTHTQTNTIQQTKIYRIIIHLYISQFMDSQIDRKTLDNFLENDMISLSGWELNTDFLGPDFDVIYYKDIHITKPFSILQELMASPPTHNSTNTNTSTTSSTISHPLTLMISTTSHSTISTTNPSPTIRHQPTATILFTSITPPLQTSYKISPLPINANPPSTTTAKSKTPPSDTQSEHLPFTFHFNSNYHSYIPQLKLSMILAKICTDIKRDVEQFIIRTEKERLTKQNKLKNNKKGKTKKVHNFKPRFQPTHFTYPYCFYDWYHHHHTKHSTWIEKANVHRGITKHPSNLQNYSHTIHPLNLQNHSHIIFSTNLPKPLFLLPQVSTSSTKHYLFTNQTPTIHWNTH